MAVEDSGLTQELENRPHLRDHRKAMLARHHAAVVRRRQGRRHRDVPNSGRARRQPRR